MRLISFRIRNFKSIIDTGVCHLSESDNILVLAGQNEAGKSAVIEALSFWRNGPSENFERLHRRKDEHPEVTCQFLLDDPEVEMVSGAIPNPSLKKYVPKNRAVGFIRGDTTKDDYEGVHFSEETTNQLQKLFPQVENANSAQIPKNDEQEQSSEGAITVKNLEELRQILFDRVREFVFFDTFDALLPGIVTIGEIPKNPAVLDFQKVFNVQFTEVVKKEARAISREEQRLNREASDNLNTYWTQKLEETSKYNFNVKIVPQPEEANSQIEFKIDRDDGDPLFMEQKSKGFRWFSAFNLRLRALGVEEAAIKNLVILIDLKFRILKDISLILKSKS